MKSLTLQQQRGLKTYVASFRRNQPYQGGVGVVACSEHPPPMVLITDCNSEKF